MTQEQIVEGNKLIAEFMGIKISHLGVGDLYRCPVTDLPTTVCELEYHESWDWLMPVIGKISENCEEPEELDSLKYALLCDDINTAWSFVVDYLSN